MNNNNSLFLFTFLIIISQCVAMLDPNDFLALQSVRKSLTDLPGSNFFATWDFTGDPCNTFAGVFCSGNKVVALNLGDPRASSPGLTGRLSPSLASLSSLAELTIVPGRIIGPLPETISKLQNLRFLAVSRNFISGEIPESLGFLRKLQTLDLSYNQLTGTIPVSIGNLPGLTHLILCHNRLTGSVPPVWSSSLNRLDLKHNDLSGFLSPYSISSSVEYLSLSSNRIEGTVDRVLSGLNRLSYLDLSMNRFSGVVPVSVFSCPITSLQLQRNFFSGWVKPVDQVRIPHLDLSYNRFSGSISPMFSTVANLYLNNNRFTGQVPGSFVTRLMASNIQTLYLQHNYLTGIELNPTAEIPLSSSLCLQYNCMVPPVHSTCPSKAGKQKSRPTSQCVEWKG